MSKQTAVITGASSGIGLELARLFAADGYDLVLTARRVERLKQLADELGKAHNTTVHILRMDLAQPHAGNALWQAISACTPNIDVLVNNAGIGDACSFAGEEPEVIERMIHLNIYALTSLTRHALPQMIARGHGKILNVASLASFQPGGPGMSVYYATKSYVLSFSRGIRCELRGSGVSITALCPGATRTEFEETAGAQHTLLFHWAKPMEASAVARAGYRALQSGRGEVVPGWLNKFLAISSGLLPMAIVLGINRFLLSGRR